MGDVGGKVYPPKAVWSQDGSITSVSDSNKTGTGTNVPDHVEKKATPL